MISDKSFKLTGIAFLICLVCLFIFTAPFTVQSGDTGELVSNTFFLRVIHPPGYPLWTLLYHLPVRYFSFVTPFFTASLVTIFITCLWIGLLIKSFRNFTSLALIAVLSTSLIFWRYAVLPDVFSLHMLFLVLVFLAFMKPELLNNKWMIFFISLSVANHHTIVFAFPLYLYAVLKGESKIKFFYSLVFGLISASLYFCLMLFNTKDYGAWGYVDNVGAVVKHFLRTEYGTFNLQSSYVEGGSEWFIFFVKSFLTNSWSVLITICFVLLTHFRLLKSFLPRIGLISFSLITYFLMFYFGNVMPLDGFGETVFERFLMQPIIFIIFLALLLTNIPGVKIPQWLVMLITINVGLNVVTNYKDVNYRQNTVIEDYVVNSLRSLPSKSIFLTYGDTLGGATYYAHNVLKIREDVVHIQPSYAYHWALRKLETQYPGVFLHPQNGLFQSFDLNKYSFFMNTPPVKLPEFSSVTNYGLIYQVSKSKEARPEISYKCDIAFNYQWRERTKLENLANYEASHIYDLEYGRCYHALFMSLEKKGEILEAVLALEKATQIAPFSVIYRERLCHIYRKLKDAKAENCDEELAILIANSNKQYYFYKYEN